MITKAILVSTIDDLKPLDKTNLVMSGIAVVDKISEALEPLIENKLGCLIISDKVIEQQASLTEVARQLDVIFKLYPKEIRVIYYKLGNDRDDLVQMLDENSNWDIYYNTEIKRVGNEGLYEAIKERQISYGNPSKQNLESVKSVLLTKANSYSNTLHMLNSKGVAGKEELNSSIIRDIPSVMLLNSAYRIVKDSLTKSSSELQKLQILNEKLYEIVKEQRNTISVTQQALEVTETSRRKIFSELTSLHSSHNVLVETLQDIVNVTELNSSLSKINNIDEIKDAPLVLYVKEITQVRFLTTFLHNFSKFLSSHVGLTKLMVIENDFNTKSIPLYEKKGIQYITDGTPLESMVLGNVLTTGVNNKLIKYLLQNSLQIETLIIYDRTALTENLVEGKDVINFYALSSLDDLSIFNLEDKLVISNDSRNTYTIGKVREFVEAKGNEQVEYSILNSLRLTKQLTSFISNWREYNLDVIEEEVKLDVSKEESTEEKIST